MENKVKFLWVTAMTGQVVKIPLRGGIERGYIIQRLLNEGVNANNLEELVFSTNEPKPPNFLRSTLPSRYQVEAALEQPFPTIPKPSAANAWPSIWSNILVRTYTPLITLKENKIQFCMIRTDGVRVDIWSFDPNSFTDKTQWDDIKNGNVGLLYAVAWKQKGKQILPPGSTFEDQFVVTHGLTSTTEYSLSATLGASYFGLSVSLSATFGQTFEVSETQTVRETVSFVGVEDKNTVICMWQLVDLFYIVKKDANGNYIFIDEYDVKINIKNGTEEYHADPLFFGNSEKRDDGNKIITNLTHPTSYLQADPTLFPISVS